MMKIDQVFSLHFHAEHFCVLHVLVTRLYNIALGESLNAPEVSLYII